MIPAPLRCTLWVMALWLGACSSSPYDDVQTIQDLAGNRDEEDAAPPPIPVVKSGPVATDTEQAVQNYEALLDLPQDPEIRAETLRRLADLQLEADEKAADTTTAESERRLRRSIELYRTILEERPEDRGNDRVLYQLARAHQNLGEVEEAERVLLRLIKSYPNSSQTDDARFRRAELLFRLGDFQAAESEYRYIISRRDATPFLQLAQYKYGWAQYKQSKFGPAVDTFLAILQQDLPPRPFSTEDEAVGAVQPARQDVTRDALRVISLSFANLGGPQAALDYFKGKRPPAFLPLLFNHLADVLLDKERYTDAAGTWTGFIDRYPSHPLAPSFQGKAIQAAEAGGFAELVVKEKTRFAQTYAPDAPYWGDRPVPPALSTALRGHVEDLARHFQAAGQEKSAARAGAGREDFQQAAQWYRKVLALFPKDSRAAELRFLLGETLYEAGATLAAAAEYDRVVNEFPAYSKAPDAAYAAVLALQRHSREVPAADKNAAMRRTVAASLKLAEQFPRHPKSMAALTRAAEELYELKQWAQALNTAGRVLRAQPPADAELRHTAWGVTADTQFGLKRWPQAERAYTELLDLTATGDPQREAFETRLATSIYRQAEAARSANKTVDAAELFLKVGRTVPGATIRAAADYDAAGMYIAAQSWSKAAAVLESFRATHAAHELLPDVDKKLAEVYRRGGQTQQAATVLRRIAGGTQAAEEQRQAAWLAATLLDEASDPDAAAEYRAYLERFPTPIDPAQEARHRLGEMAAATGQARAALRWQRAIIEADRGLGAASTTRSRTLAAEALLQLGRAEATTARAQNLRLPLSRSLPPRRQAMERAIQTLTEAADYGIAEVTTAATFELGRVYQDLSRALLDSDRPSGLSALELDQYNLLLEEQAFPFEERAIQWHETNLKRVQQKVFDPWIVRSLNALAQIAPGQFGKRERTAKVYDGLR